LRSLRLGIPTPPYSLHMVMLCQLAKCHLCLSVLSFQRQLAIWEEIVLIAHLGNFINDSRYTEIDVIPVWSLWLHRKAISPSNLRFFA
jgi:hypothetical protein